MTPTEIYATLHQLTIAVAVVAFTFAVILPCVFYSECDNDFATEACKVINRFVRAKLRPLLIGLVIVDIVFFILTR